MSSFTIKVEGLDKIKGKLDGERLYGKILRENLALLAQIALARARDRAPRNTGAIAATLGTAVSNYPVPTWSKVTYNPAAGSQKGFRYGYALDVGGSAGGRAYHYRVAGGEKKTLYERSYVRQPRMHGTMIMPYITQGKKTFGWLHKVKSLPTVRAAIKMVAAKMAEEIKAKWRQ